MSVVKQRLRSQPIREGRRAPEISSCLGQPFVTVEDSAENHLDHQRSSVPNAEATKTYRLAPRRANLKDRPSKEQIRVPAEPGV
jgi:hypothetical protein